MTPRRSWVICSRSSSRGTSADPADLPGRWTRRCGPGAPTTSCSWTTTSSSTPRASCGRRRSLIWPAVPPSWGATCSACTTGRCCTRTPKRSNRTHGGGARRRTPRPGTTSGGGTCGTPRGCTAAPMPTTVIREIGLSLPAFIKWDDAEYGVRARDRGFPTVSLPGVASWQVPWDEKDDARNWQAYYHLRNRLVSALLHSPAAKGGALVSESLERQLQSLLSMQ